MQPSQMKIRFHETVTHDWIKQQAKINKRSLNAEVNHHLEQAMLKYQQEQHHETQKA